MLAARLRCALTALLLAAAGPAGLPPGSVIDPRPDDFPVQILRSEQAGGWQSHQVALGNTAFSSPLLFGEVARVAGLSCNSCHVNGHINRGFFIPGLSARPGGLDVTGPLFHPAADNGVADHTDIPSLRGVRLLGPYGRDGRIASLREFTRQVIMDEFGGPEPPPAILDALVAYMNEFEFVPNARLGPMGTLRDPTATEAAGERAFAAPRAGFGGASCASCHDPRALFADRRVHDVGTGGIFRAPTLLNANDSAPYGHDGRWADYGAVLDHFDRAFGLGLGGEERSALIAYLTAIGSVDDAAQPASFRAEMSELALYVDALEAAIRRRDPQTARFVAETVVLELRRVQRDFPDGETPSAYARRPDRIVARPDFDALVAGLRDIAGRADRSETQGALDALDAYHDLARTMTANYPRARRAP